MRPGTALGSPPPQNVAVVRALEGLGDLLCSVPALRALKASLPDARITLIGLPSARAFVRRFSHYLDDFLEFPGYPGIPERPLDVPRATRFFSRSHRAGFDLALQMHGSGLASNAFTMMLGAKRSAGFFLPGLYCPAEDSFLAYPGDQPEIRRHLRLVEFLGIPAQGEHLEWPITAEDERALEALEETRALDREAYVCVHPGARDPRRRWSPAGFARVADWLASQGLQVVLTGSEQEAPVVAAVSGEMTSSHVSMAGRTTVGALGALLAGARLLVTNDTAPSHIAAALRVPSVVVFTASDSSRWAPLDRHLHRPVGNGIRDAHPCSAKLSTNELCLRDACAAPSRLGLATFDVPTIEEVRAEAARLLKREGAGAR